MQGCTLRRTSSVHTQGGETVTRETEEEPLAARAPATDATKFISDSANLVHLLLRSQCTGCAARHGWLHFAQPPPHRPTHGTRHLAAASWCQTFALRRNSLFFAERQQQQQCQS